MTSASPTWISCFGFVLCTRNDFLFGVPAGADVLFELVAKFCDIGLNRPGGRIREDADRHPFHVAGDGEKVTGLVYRDRNTEEVHTVALEGIFVQIGLVPNTEWLKGSIGLSNRGEIEVDARGETSLPGVFAAGDATTVPYKQIIIAMGEGSKAALSAFDYLIRH